MILVIDNYDSFTYNLVQYLEELGADVRVARNDQIGIESIVCDRPRAIVVSPGPKTPDAAGISVDLIRSLSGRIPILGVCLGHQAIAQAFGARIVPAPSLMHGKTSAVRHDGQTLFRGLPNPFQATRYHSLVVDRGSLPGDLQISATTDGGVIMGLRHKRHATEGVQFHPESILTPEGKPFLRNFLEHLPGWVERMTETEHGHTRKDSARETIGG